MKGLKLKFKDFSIRHSIRAFRQRRHLLKLKGKKLLRQRTEQAHALQQIDLQIDEVKRRINAAQRRIRLLRNKERLEWLEQTRQEADSAKSSQLDVKIEVVERTPATLPKPRARLGELLLAAGYITEEQLETAMESQRNFGGRLGNILLELKYVTIEQLNDMLDKQQTNSRLGDMLLQYGYLTPYQLDKAIEFQRKSGGLLGDVLLSLRFIEPEQLYRMISSQSGLGRIGSYIHFDSQRKLPESTARKYNAVILHQYSDRYLVAVTEPLPENQKEELEQLLQFPIEQVLASDNEMELFWSEVYSDEMLLESTEKLVEVQPHNSASKTFTRGQLITFTVMASLSIIAFVIFPFGTFIALNVMLQVFYFSMTLFKFLIIMYGSRSGAQYRFTDEELQSIDERELPVYTILVPMYKESEVIPQLIHNMEQLDYPKAKLDVRLLIEEDDVEAQQLLKSMRLPSYYATIIVPHGLPKTKPKACNYGLIRALGDYVVIYDAEDRPDPDQLKKVYMTFKACSAETVCVQAKLNYFNSEQNLLTRWFTQEYSMWFELLLPGIMQLDIPIPLGGTSNHFKIDVLRELNAWDPYNVTEDADLGIRLYKEGYKTAIVDSRTWEEANSRFGNWIRQRSRWIKGYMQTWLVHMRNPLKLWKDIGTKAFVGIQVVIFASPVIPILNPFFWLMLVLWYCWKLEFIPQLFPGIVYYMSAIGLYLGNFFFVFANIAGVYWVINDMERRKQDYISHRIVKYALLTPLYWLMMSIAAYKAAWQLITKPFYWEKTTHGLDTTSQQGPPVT